MNNISVREEEGQKILSNRFDQESTLVLDPTLLLKKEEYEKLITETYDEKIDVAVYFVMDHENTILNDKIFVITGKLSVTRDKLKAELEEAGAKVTGSVSTKTDYLIANAPENTTKYKKAKTLNIPIISEAQVRIMLQS